MIEIQGSNTVCRSVTQMKTEADLVTSLLFLTQRNYLWMHCKNSYSLLLPSVTISNAICMLKHDSTGTKIINS